MPLITCRPKSLPAHRLAAAARRAIEINPDNAAEQRQVARTPIGRRGGPRRIAVVVARKWPKRGVRLSVSFMDNPPRALRSRILLHMNAWGEAANVVFAETEGTGEVRIARLDSPVDMAGYWSYVGTEILDADEDEPTMNLEGFTMKETEAEFRRVVRHEAGHTLGFDHEHMRSEIVRRIDRKKAIAYFDKHEGWTEEEVEEQVLTPLARKSIMGTAEADPLSIMCYQLPASIMKDRKPIKGGVDINPKDFAFAAKLYPKKDKEDANVVPARAPSMVTPVTATPLADDDYDTFHLIVLDEFKPEVTKGPVAQESPEFAQILASYGGARVTSAMRLRSGGDGKTLFGQIIGMHERIRNYTNRERGSLPTDDQMVAFGRQLFETLLQGDVRRLYDEARTRQRRRRLDFVLTSMIPWISEKPWEFAYDGGRGSFLATEEIHFVRNVLTSVPADPIVRSPGPLRILVAAAQPVGFDRLSVEQETEVISRGFQPLVDAGLVEIAPYARVTPDQLHDLLKAGTFQVVHFIGHGVFNEERREGCLVFENERGGEVMLGQRQLREIFCKRGLSLVFLNACESGRGGRADFNKGVAQSLVAKGLPALVANQYSVLDSSATSFAQYFYASLAQGLSIGEAGREARIAVNYSMHGELIDWAVPVLYARDPGMTLCPPAATSRIAPLSTARAARRRATPKRDAQIAVWDVDDVFPSIGKTLSAMNEAQEVFGFELVDVSVPLDVWDLDRSEGINFLRAERVARRLQAKPAELGVDILACVTRHWLRDDDWLYLYGWWPADQKPPVVIFSVAGFDELKPEGPDTDRAIANTVVTCLAGFYGNVDSHTRAPKDCPMSFNQARDIKHLVGPQKFDAKCRLQLKRRLGTKLGALEALLRAFQ